MPATITVNPAYTRVAVAAPIAAAITVAPLQPKVSVAAQGGSVTVQQQPAVKVVTVPVPRASVSVALPRATLITVGQQGIQGPIGLTGGGLLQFEEVPAGVIDGTNRVFTLANTVSPPQSLLLYKNGLKQLAGAGNDFQLSGNTITFEAGTAVPLLGDYLLTTYGR